MIKEDKESITFIEKIILWMFVMDLLIGKWIFNISENRYIYSIIIVYFIYMFITKKYNIEKSDLISITIIVVILYINILVNGKNGNFFSYGILFGVGNLLIIKFFIQLFQSNRRYMKEVFIVKLRKVFNGYFWINSIVMYKQLNGTYFLMRHYQNNPMYEDHITGFIGASGTHRLTLFWIALIVFNINYYLDSKRKTTLLTVIIQLIYMIIMSAYNDNTIFYVLMPLILVEVYGIRLVKKIGIKKLFLVVVATIIFINTFNYLKTVNVEVDSFLSTRVSEKICQLANSEDENIDDEERIELLKYSLKYGNGYKFGVGIGSVSYSDSRLSRHFGMSEISIKTYEGGLIYLFELILLYSTYMHMLICRRNSIRSKIILFIIVFFNILMMASYTQIFRIPQLIEGMVLIAIGIDMGERKLV